MVSKNFILAGKSIFTIELPSGYERTHYTYKVSFKEGNDRFPEGVFFVSLLTGPNNEEDYQYMGILKNPDGVPSIKLTGKSRFTESCFPVRLLNRILLHIWEGNYEKFESHGFQVHHEGKCGRCGKTLTVPESIESGFGPECIKKV